jgi:hypothetical protein
MTIVYEAFTIQRSCKQTAIDFCKGGSGVKEHIEAVAGCSIDSNVELNELKSDCEPTVDCLLGIEPDDDICACVLDGNCT